MDGRGPERPLSDAALDRELESALGIEPSPEFLARVRTRIATEPAAKPWLVHAVSRFYLTSVVSRRSSTEWALQPLVGVAVVGVVLALVIPRWARDEVTVVPPSQATRTEVAAAATQVPTVRGERGVVAVPRQPRQRTSEPIITRVRMSEPMFSDEDRRALEMLVTAVAQGRVPPMPAATDVDIQIDAMNEMRIEPLMIEPLPQLARVEDRGEVQ